MERIQKADSLPESFRKNVLTHLSHAVNTSQEEPYSRTNGISTSSDHSRWWISRLICFASVSIIGLAGDLLSKQWVFSWRGLPGESPTWWLFEGYVGIQTAVNPGALFGFGAGWGKAFAVLSIIAATGIVVWLFSYKAARSWWITIASACVLGGIFGNMYDRLGLWYSPGLPAEWSSGVRDWILFCYHDYTWPNFNIADSLLVCGTGVLAWRSLFCDDPQSSVLPKRSPSEDSAAVR
jgi:signal peptidase II